jgi:alpha-2-macroglobulin
MRTDHERVSYRGAALVGRLWGLIGTVLICLACSGQSRAPEAVLPPAGTIGPQHAAAASPRLVVVYAGPSGAAERNSSIHLLFDRPLRALDGAAPVPSVTLEPAVPGQWTWVGTRGLGFVPAAGRLPQATSFRVALPAGTQALDGTTLAEAFELRFDTPAPHVLEVTPESGASGAEPGVPIGIRFDQPVASETVARLGQLTALHGKRRERLAFDVRPRPGPEGWLSIVPRRPLPLGAGIELSLPAELQSKEGPLPLGHRWSSRFDTYGPLRVVAVRCDLVPHVGRCDPEGGVWVELSNAVQAGDLSRRLAIEPPLPLRWPDDLESESRYFQVPLVDGLPAAATLRVSVAAGLLDEHGQRLVEPYRATLVSADYSPRVLLPVSGEVFVPPLSELGLVSRNVTDLRVRARRLDAPGLLDLFSSQNDYEQNRALLERLIGGGVALPGQVDNQIHTHPIALAPVLDGAARGAAWIGWRTGASVSGQVVQVTDLGLTAKLSEQGSLVWVTRLGTGQPVAGASVELIGRSPPVSRSYRTDADGLVQIPAADYRPRLLDYGAEDDTLLIARLEGDSAFRRVSDFLPPWRLEVPSRLSVAEKSLVLLFSERGIYRPGDVTRVKGILRKEAPSGNTLPVGQKLSLELRDPFDEVAATSEVETSRFGTFSAALRVPSSASLGQWRVLAKELPDDALSFQVAEYRAAEFAVRVEPARPTYLEGATAVFRTQAEYLFGSPMSGMPITCSVSRERTTFSPPGAERYAVGDDVYRRDLTLAPLDQSTLSQKGASLSPEGRHEASVPLLLPGQLGPENVRLDASVSDISRQVVAASASVLVHPASFYIGIARPESWFLPVPSRLEPAVVALSPTGEKLAGRSLSLELVRRRWTLVRSETQDGWRTLSEPVDEVQGSCSVVTGRQPVACPLEIAESGQFFVRATGKDERGRSASSAIELYAIGAGRPSWPDNDQRKLEIVLDRPQYSVGDTARLLIKNPFLKAEALFTLERGGVIEHRRVQLEGPTPTLEIPVGERLRPNAFVSVHLVQGVSAAVPPQAQGAPAQVEPEAGYRIGYAQLRVDPEARRLAVRVASAAPEYRPGQTAHFELSVSGPGGVPQAAELTVYAVDEGVLSLTGYEPPDPVAIFMAPRPLAVATLESRDALGRLLSPGLERDKGSDGGGGGALGIRSNFRTTAFFDASVQTDARGQARVQFELPDNLTTFRLMAVAVSDDDRYGVGSTTFRVNEPLMLRPALPRVLRVGDRVEAAVIVNARGTEALETSVELAVTGATLEGPASRKVQVSASGSSEVRFVLVADRPGEARFDFSATAGALSDRVQTSLRVSSPSSLESTALYGRTDQAEAQALGDLAGLRQDVGGLTVSLASTALVGLDAALTSLAQYPYACTEQLASALLPLTALSELGARYGLDVPADAAAAAEARVGQILSRQREDGGFGLWPDSERSHPWASAYALWVLEQARRGGARLPARSADLGVAYLRRELAEPRARPDQWATAALMLDVLAALGQPDPEYVTRLFEARKELPSSGRALLLHAAVLGKSDPALTATLATELQAGVSVDGNQAHLAAPEVEPSGLIFDSEARTEALYLWALLAQNPAHPLAAPLARGVLARRNAGGWRSTQESAYALLALDAYRRAQEADTPHFDAAVWFGRERLLTAGFEGPSAQPKARSIGMQELRGLSGNLVFEKQGTGSLFYEARLAYAPERLPDAALERGFSLQRSLRRVDMAALSESLEAPFDPGLSPAAFAGGDLALVDVVVGAPGLRRYVVIEDPLPAGFEAVDASLATSSPALDVNADPEREGRSGFASSWHRRELRDDRVLFFVDEMPAGLYRYRYLARATALGRFVVPPTRVHEMYQPEVFARSAASSLEIR